MVSLRCMALYTYNAGVIMVLRKTILSIVVINYALIIYTMEQDVKEPKQTEQVMPLQTLTPPVKEHVLTGVMFATPVGFSKQSKDGLLGAYTLKHTLPNDDWFKVQAASKAVSNWEIAGKPLPNFPAWLPRSFFFRTDKKTVKSDGETVKLTYAAAGTLTKIILTLNQLESQYNDHGPFDQYVTWLRNQPKRD